MARLDADTRQSLLAIVLLGVHAVLSVAAVPVLVSAAYAASASWGGNVQLSSVGGIVQAVPSARWIVYGLPLIGLASFIGTVIAIAHPASRSDAWYVPVLGMVASAILILIVVVGFPATAR